MSLSILLAPSGFKESLDAPAVCREMAVGVRRAVPDADIRCVPLVDGGEGFARGMVAATGGELVEDLEVTGPVGQRVTAAIGILGGPGPRTAVLEMAAAAGLSLVPREERDPGQTTTRGVGELIGHALDLEPQRILVGCGDSGTNDGGAGMAQALGAKLLDADGEALGPGGARLAQLERIDLDGLDPRLRDVRIEVACNVHNVLCGERGVARVFGPQKGASEEQVEALAAALDTYAEVVQRTTGIDVATMPGGGASGGLGTGLHALLGATLRDRFDVVMAHLDLERHLGQVDLVLTAEGSIDVQTPRGKIPAEVGRRAQAHGVPTVAIAGTVGRQAAVNLDAGVDAYASILQGPATLGEAIDDAARLVRHATESTIRTVLVGRRIAHRAQRSAAAPAAGDGTGGGLAAVYAPSLAMA